jgi:hypothetical protein
MKQYTPLHVHSEYYYKMKLDFPLHRFVELCEKVVAYKDQIKNGHE